MQKKDPLNTRFVQPSYVGNPYEFIPIIGVIKDFHFESMDNEIKPMVIHFMPGNWEGKLIIKMGDGDRAENIKFIQGRWEEFSIDRPFDYIWLDEEFARLLDLISFATSQHTREVGIRKIMGTSTLTVQPLPIRPTA